MERLKIAVVGLNFGKYIVGQLKDGDAAEFFDLAAVCDLSMEKAKEVEKATGAKALPDLDAVLASPQIPVVGIFTGPVGRAELIRRAVRAGKDVITTKPFERDAAAALDVLREAQELGRVVVLNSPSPLLPPDLQQVQDWQRKFSLGRPVACRRDVWVSYREKADGRWYDDPDQCPVAPVFRLGIYLINDLVRLWGEAERVQVMSSRLFTGRPTADNAQLGIQFKNGALANISASFCVKDGDHYRNTMVLNFENGTVYRNCGPVRRSNDGSISEMALVIHDGHKRLLAEQISVPGGSGEYPWEIFYRLIQGERPDGRVTPEEIAAGIRIIEAMAEAERTGGTAIVRPVKTVHL